MDCISKTIWLLRHPETDWNEQKRYQGTSDRPLSKTGKEQLQKTATFFDRIPLNNIFSSQRQHAKELAGAIAKNYSPSIEVSILDGLNEIDHGNWEGLTYEEVKTQFPDSCRMRFENIQSSKVHGGENLNEILARVQESWKLILNSKESKVAIVCHATPIQLILCEALGIPFVNYWQFQIKTASISKLERAKDGFILCQLN